MSSFESRSAEALEALRKDLVSQTTHLTDLETRVAELRLSNANQAGQITTLKQSTVDQATVIAELRESNFNKTNEIQELKRSLVEMANQILDLQRAKDRQKREMDELEQKKSQLEAKVSDLVAFDQMVRSDNVPSANSDIQKAARLAVEVAAKAKKITGYLVTASGQLVTAFPPLEVNLPEAGLPALAGRHREHNESSNKTDSSAFICHSPPKILAAAI